VATTVVLALAPAAMMLGRSDVSAPPDQYVESGFSRTDSHQPSAISHDGRRLPNILLLGIDGVDAPATSAYGNARDTTPFLKRFAGESLLFENAFTNVARTHGALVALLTGRSPFATHVTFPPTILQGDDARKHLLSVLKPMGYTTLQIGMRHYADAEDANLIGFDAANYRWQRIEDVGESGGPAGQTDVFRSAVVERFDERAARLFGAAGAIDGFAHIQGETNTPYWSDDRRVDTLMRYFEVAREPWLVHAHLLDTHCCNYRPKAMRFPEEPNTAQRAHDSQLRETDAQLETLVGALEADGRLDRTIVVIYSDHTARWTAKGRVPLIIRLPGGMPRGRVAANVQLADVAPTILDALEVETPGWMDGASLLDHHALPPDRPILGVSDIAPRQSVAPHLNALRNAEPPNYGAMTVTLIQGSEWFELNLLDGELTSGPVPGHTNPAAASVSPETARELLMARLESAGFKVGPQP
jgi:arylsulfatase A-like enzyme